MHTYTYWHNLKPSFTHQKTRINCHGSIRFWYQNTMLPQATKERVGTLDREFEHRVLNFVTFLKGNSTTFEHTLQNAHIHTHRGFQGQLVNNQNKSDLFRNKGSWHSRNSSSQARMIATSYALPPGIDSGQSLFLGALDWRIAVSYIFSWLRIFSSTT